MSEIHTIITNNSRKLYLPYYLMFIGILGVSFFLFIDGQLALPALGAAAVMVFLGLNATEIHRMWEGYEVNPSAVVHTKGLISKKSRRIDLFAINTVSVHQSLFQRLLNLGDIHVHVANASHVTTLKNLHAPKIFAQAIQNNMHKIRNVYHSSSANTRSNNQTPLRPKNDETQQWDYESSHDLQEI